jgi:hypothetical protein
MKLPGGSIAIVDREKLADYCLSPHHPRGKHKARVFASVLGYTAEYADRLRADLLAAAATQEVQSTTSDEFGGRYVIDFAVDGLRGRALVRSTWIIRHGETSPRLTSCYVK